MSVLHTVRQVIEPGLEHYVVAWTDSLKAAGNATNPAARRAANEAVGQALRLPTPLDVDADREVYFDTPLGSARCRLFRNRTAGPQPCLFYIPGGAFVIGSAESHWDVAAALASQARQTVITIDYLKAPEHPFPQAYEQCLTVARTLRTRAGEFNLRPDAMTIGGDSAGGNIAAAVAQRLHDDGMAPCGQLLVYPLCDFDRKRPSYQENARGPILFPATLDLMEAQYCPDRISLFSDPRAAPLLRPDFTGLPPAFVAVAEYDPLRDSGVVYAQALGDAAVPVTFDAGPGMIHGYLRALRFSPAAREIVGRIADWLIALGK